MLSSDTECIVGEAQVTNSTNIYSMNFILDFFKSSVQRSKETNVIRSRTYVKQKRILH